MGVSSDTSNHRCADLVLRALPVQAATARAGTSTWAAAAYTGAAAEPEPLGYTHDDGAAALTENGSGEGEPPALRSRHEPSMWSAAIAAAAHRHNTTPAAAAPMPNTSATNQAADEASTPPDVFNTGESESDLQRDQTSTK